MSWCDQDIRWWAGMRREGYRAEIEREASLPYVTTHGPSARVTDWGCSKADLVMLLSEGLERQTEWLEPREYRDLFRRRSRVIRKIEAKREAKQKVAEVKRALKVPKPVEPRVSTARIVHSQDYVDPAEGGQDG